MQGLGSRGPRRDDDDDVPWIVNDEADLLIVLPARVPDPPE